MVGGGGSRPVGGALLSGSVETSRLHRLADIPAASHELEGGDQALRAVGNHGQHVSEHQRPARGHPEGAETAPGPVETEVRAMTPSRRWTPLPCSRKDCYLASELSFKPARRVDEEPLLDLILPSASPGPRPI